MVKMALLWRFSARFCSGQPVLWVVRHSASDSLPRVRFHPSVNVKGPASATHLPSNPVLPCMLSTRLYSTEVVDSEKLTFEEYRKLRKSLKMRGRVAGLPMALLGMGISSFVNVQYNPDMFNMAPEDVQPIL